jgi:DNA-directed RNA polymerase subunit RPC12/RpoP
VSGNESGNLERLRSVGRRGTQAVVCLECGTTYPKPVKGGTTARNPGCPNCGYVGWLEVEVTVRVGRGADDAKRITA